MSDVDDKIWFYWAPPATVLAANLLTVTTGAIWRDNIGLSACAYRIPYSPYGEAFAIWGLLYLWADLAHAVQCAPAPLPTARPAANLFAALAWAMCALWIWLFDATVRPAIVLSGVAISTAAAAAVAAAVLEGHAWIDPDAWPLLLLSVLPNSLLGGWLVAASSLGLGSAWKALLGQAPECVDLKREDRRRRNRPGNEAAEATRAPSWVPPALALLVAAVSAWPLNNPALPLPLAWAVWNMGPYGAAGEEYPYRYYAAILLCLASSVVSAVRYVLIWYAV